VRTTVNGEQRELPDGTTVAVLLEILGVPLSGVAVARNDRIVRRAEYGAHELADGDHIEIIKAVAGG
jgi:sulfur carrier protein